MSPPTLTAAAPSALAGLERRHARIHVIVAPPRSSSTALARVFWERPEVRYYSHEPFEVTYYRGRGVERVLEKLSSPVDLDRWKCVRRSEGASELVIKEMPYQVGERFPLLADLATPPLVFLVRDPRRTIASRMAKKREAGDGEIFPEIESGWELLRSQVDWCRAEGVPHLLVDASDFRNRPGELLARLFARLGLPFEEGMLCWKACPELELDNLGGRHRHLYERVLSSTGVLPEATEPPSLDLFPERAGWRAHVERCLEIYRRLRDREERIRLPARAARA